MVTNCSGEKSFSRFKTIKNELKGRNVPWEVVRTKHSISGLTRLGGARGKKLVCAHMFEPEVFRKQCTVLKKVLVTLLGLFSSPAVISRAPQWCGPPVVIWRPGNCAPYAPPSLRPCIRYIKSEKLRQTNCNEFLHNFVMKKAGQNPFNCLLCYVQPYLIRWSYLFISLYVFQ